MVVNVCGIQQIDFTNDKGDRIQGLNLYLETPVNSSSGAGYFTTKKFVSRDRILGKPRTGDAELDINFNGGINNITFS